MNVKGVARRKEDLQSEANEETSPPLPLPSCSSSSFFDGSELGNQGLGGSPLHNDTPLRIEPQADLYDRSPGAADADGGNIIDVDPRLHGDSGGSQHHPFGVSDAEKLGERHVLVWLRDQLEASGGKSLELHHTDVFHGNTQRLLAFMELLGRRVALVDGKECLIKMRGPWVDVSWTNVKCGGTAAQDSQSKAKEGAYPPLPPTTCSTS